MKNWYRLPGVRPHERKLVGLLFAHSSLLGFGTMLAYLSASELLLRAHAAPALPLAYCAGALAMLVAGRLCGAAVPLRASAGWALLAALGCLLALGALRWRGPTVATAVTGLVAYRLVYLLTQLDFGRLAATLSPLPSRRLLGVGTAGELPAKALGALLGFALPTYSGSNGLLLGACAAVGVALLVRRAALRAGARPRLAGQPAALGERSGSSPLGRTAGLSLALLAAVGAVAEYAFFACARFELPSPASAMQYVGGGLALTYLLATLGKPLFARYGRSGRGVRRVLLGLPLVALAGVVGLGGGASATSWSVARQLDYFGGLCLGLELLRRAGLEPVFWVLLHSLPPAERHAGYAQALRVYVPLGLALGGLLLLALPQGAALPQWLLASLVALLLAALVSLRQTYQGYLATLKRTLGLPPSLASPAAPAALTLTASRAAIHALTQLYQADAAGLIAHAEALLQHADGQVRHHTLHLLGRQTAAAVLCQLATADPDPALREHASRLACQHPAAADWLRHPDLAVRKGTISGRLAAVPTDAQALASLADLVASPDLSCRLCALALLGWLTPAQQVALLTASLHDPEPTLVQAAEHAAAATPSRPLIEHLIGLLRSRAVRQPATNSLVQLGAAALPLLRAALTQATSSPHLHSLTQVCARLATPAARQLLLEVAQRDLLTARAAALRALGSFAAVPADAPRFQHLLAQEMQLAQHLLHGMLTAAAELQTALRYELRAGLRRVFGLLLQVYERPPIRAAQRRILHTFGPQQAEALALLDDLLPRPLCQGLQALTDTSELPERIKLLDDLLGPLATDEPVAAAIVRRGPAAFSAWTLSVALPQWHPQPATVAHLYPHLQSDNLLIRESALAVLRQLPVQRPAAYDLLLTTHPNLTPLLMPTPESSARTSARERVLLLKGTALFADTPANVLGSIVPIVQEVAFEPGQVIFAQGTLGTSLFIVCAGEVGIFDSSRQLITFHKGDFFGELALLDAEARSASAIAQGPVVALRIDQEDFYDLIEECPEVVRNILQVLCQRLRRQNEQLRPAVPLAR